MVVLVIRCKTCGWVLELRSNEGFPSYCPQCCGSTGWKPAGPTRPATEKEQAEEPRWKPDKYE